MLCPKCRQENLESAQYCVRCHAPVRYVCPACKHVQLQGGKCEKCGVDFAKYAAMLAFEAQQDTNRARERTRSRVGLLKQILLLPITGGISFVKYLLEQIKGA